MPVQKQQHYVISKKDIIYYIAINNNLKNIYIEIIFAQIL